MARLFSIDEAERLSCREVQQLYRDYVNPGQVDLISSFQFGHDLPERAQGMWIETRSGRRILDFTGGIGVLNLGHNHPRLIAARRRYGEMQRPEVHKNYFSRYTAALSHNIGQLLPKALNKFFFPNSGSEANEGAIKLAYLAHRGRRKHILHSDIAFHGKLLGASSVSSSPELHRSFPKIPGTLAFRYNCIESLKALVQRTRNSSGDSDVYAIILEPLSASTLRECSAEFLVSVRELCNRERIYLIYDEVYTGWGKTGEVFHFMRYPEAVPDILTMAKSLGGGKATIAGYASSEEVFCKAYGNLRDAILHSTTFNGFGEETATAIEAINILMEERLTENATAIENYLKPRLIELCAQFPEFGFEPRGRGALLGLVLNQKRGFDTLPNFVGHKISEDPLFWKKVQTGAIINHLYSKHGILTYFGTGDEIPLMISPSLVCTQNEMDIFLKALQTTLSVGKYRLLLEFANQKYLGRGKRPEEIFQNDSP